MLAHAGPVRAVAIELHLAGERKEPPPPVRDDLHDAAVQPPPQESIGDPIRPVQAALTASHFFFVSGAMVMVTLYSDVPQTMALIWPPSISRWQTDPFLT